MLRYSPLILTSELQLTPKMDHAVLVQLSSVVPTLVESYGRVIEVVSLDEADRADARKRWRVYADWGMDIQKHDLALKENS